MGAPIALMREQGEGSEGILTSDLDDEPNAIERQCEGADAQRTQYWRKGGLSLCSFIHGLVPVHLSLAPLALGRLRVPTPHLLQWRSASMTTM